MPEALLEVEDVHSGYGAGDILQGVSLSVRKGEIVAVVGRNGVGKTTLMRTVMGLLQLRAGAINHHGRPIVGLSPQARAKAGFGYVPQGKMIFPFLTVAENLKMGERVGGAARPWDQIFDMFPRTAPPAGRHAERWPATGARHSAGPGRQPGDPDTR
jgi:branched-chain amino acid transport system ATP-binding protein